MQDSQGRHSCKAETQINVKMAKINVIVHRNNLTESGLHGKRNKILINSFVNI